MIFFNALTKRYWTGGLNNIETHAASVEQLVMSVAEQEITTSS